jgi:PAS domain S-box-containing protein
LESAPDAILLVDAQGRIDLVNRRTEELFGYERHALFGCPVEILVPERLRAIHVQHRDEYVAEPRTRPMGVGLELHGRRADGSEFPVEISLSPMERDGETFVITIVRDITERRAAEAERLELARAHAARDEAEGAARRLRLLQAVTEEGLEHLALERLLPSVLERLRDGLDADLGEILLVGEDADELIVAASFGGETDESSIGFRVPFGVGFSGRIAAERAAKIFADGSGGRSPGLRSISVRSLVGAPLLLGDDLLGVVQVARTAGSPFDAADAQLLSILAERIALAVQHGRLYEAERLAHGSAESAQARLGGLLAGLDAVVWEAETDTRDLFTYVSAAAEPLLGYPLSHWLTEHRFWERIIHPDDRDATLLFFREAAREGEAHKLEYRLKAADGRVVWVRDVVSPVEDGAGAGLRGVIVDITERRDLEARLLQAQKLEAVGQLAGGVAHDFNNLLTVIGGYTRLLLSQGLGPEASDLLGEINAAAERAATLTQQLLAFSRRAPQTRELFDLNETVRGIEGMLRGLVEEDIAFELELAEDLPPLCGDPRQFEQVVVNLVLNARDATPPGGRVRIETSIAEATDEAPTPSGTAYGVLRVTDTGLGMSNETRARIFEPFFTTKERGKGTGLGLSMVYGIVEQSGGRIDVESELGRGTSVRVLLPAGVEEPPAEPAASEPERPTILVAEDEPSLRRLAMLVLEEAGYRVILAQNGTEALELAQGTRDRIDLLLTDVVMPELSGPELVAQLAALRPETRVLYMSGYADSRLIARGVSETDAGVLPKPFGPHDLLKRVQEILE